MLVIHKLPRCLPPSPQVAMQTLLYVLPQLAGVVSFVVVGLTKPEVRGRGGVGVVRGGDRQRL